MVRWTEKRHKLEVKLSDDDVTNFLLNIGVDACFEIMIEVLSTRYKDLLPKIKDYCNEGD